MRHVSGRTGSGGRPRAGRACLVLLLAAFAAVGAGAVSAFDDAVALYRAARFDEALLLLDKLENPTAAGGALSGPEKENASEVRALCLLALDRDSEAKTVVQEMLRRRITYRPRSGDVPPRFAAIVHESRSEIWRTLVRDEYRAGKSAYEKKVFRAAEEHLGNVLRLMGEPDIDPGVRDSLTDVGDLAKDFLALTAAANIVPPLPAAAAAPVGTAGAGTAAPGPVAREPVYSATDAGIQPPVTIRQELPGWRSTGVEQQVLRGQTGMLEVVIDPRGRVETARMYTPVHPIYDSRLVAAAAGWQYRPATKNGVPVRYKKLIQVHLVDQK
jgi:hypothetical protein